MKLIKFLSLIIVALVLVNVTLTNRTVDESLYLSQLSSDINSLQEDNLLRQTRIAQLGSLPVLAEKIEAAGFVETPTVVALPTPASVALR